MRGLRASGRVLRASQRVLRASRRGLEGQSEWSEGQLEGSEGQSEGYEGQLNGRTSGWAEGRNFSPFYRTSSLTGAAAQKEKKEQSFQYMGKKPIRFTNNKLFSYFADSMTPFSNQYTMKSF